MIAEVGADHLTRNDPWVVSSIIFGILAALGLGALGLSHLKTLVAASANGDSRWLFRWGPIVVGSGVAVFATFVDGPGFLKNEVPTYFWWTFPLFVCCFAIEIVFLRVEQAKSDAEQEEREASDHLAEIVQRNDERRERIAQIVNEKAQNVRKLRRSLEISRSALAIVDVERAFQPQQQMLLNMVGLYAAIRQLVGRKGRMRVAVFFPDE